MNKMAEFKDVTKRFDNRTVLEHISFSVEGGKTYWIRGDSGIGKTTLLRMLLGLEKPAEGEIWRRKGLRFSAVFQEDRLLEYLSAVKNVRLVCSSEITEEDIRRHLLKLLPADSLDKPVTALSGGMKRRAAIVRACLAESDLLVFDEPFTGLDEECIREAAAYIRQYQNERAIVISSHRGDISLLCGQDIFLR